MSIKNYSQTILFVFTCLLFTPIFSDAQTISSGPVVGGVSENSARFFIRTHTDSVSFILQLDTDSSFSQPIELNGSTSLVHFGSTIMDVSGLSASATYYYRVLINGIPDVKDGHFKTFPTRGTKANVKIAWGSCNYFDNHSLFQQIKDFKPDLFIHTGDWAYPPTIWGDYHVLSDSLSTEAFAWRYNIDMMNQYILPFSAIDYIYDDSYTHSGAGLDVVPRYSYQIVNGAVIHELREDTLPAGITQGAIRAYHNNFPGYDLPDTSGGIFHKFSIGNTDIFMVDNRLFRTSEFRAFPYDSIAQKYTFEPSDTHTILGEKQREWLLSELQNSTADWKIVGSGVAFNRKLRNVLEASLNYQDTIVDVLGFYQGTGMTLALSMAYMWAGYPADQDPLIELYQSGHVKNLFMVTGDTHSSALDNGYNSGIPEMNTSGLASEDEGYFNFLFTMLAGILNEPWLRNGEDIWNGGGSGLRNTGFADSFGTTEIFEDDSIKFCIYDEIGQNLGCLTYTKDYVPTNISNSHFSADPTNFLLAYPNPTKDLLILSLQENIEASILIFDMSGKEIWRKENVVGSIEIDLTQLPSGTYLINCYNELINESKQFVKN